MRTRWRALSVAVLGLFLILLAPGRARAAGAEDAAAIKTAQEVLEGDYSSGNFLDAKRKLEAALARCGKCSAQAQAPLHILLGMVASQTGQKSEAKAQFQMAQQADPSAQLPPRTTPDIRAQWDEAKGATATPADGAGDASATE
ncbi:MAG: hypothetical protein ABSE49_03010, partial [Polyangiaceae bacterium]